jgi:hypothetical protein
MKGVVVIGAIVLLVLASLPVRAATEIQARPVTDWAIGPPPYGYRVSGDLNSFKSVDGNEFVAGETESAFESDTPVVLANHDGSVQWSKTASCTNHTDCVDDPWFASDLNATITNSISGVSSDLFHMDDLGPGFIGWQVDSVLAHIVARRNNTAVNLFSFSIDTPNVGGPACTVQAPALTQAFTLFSYYLADCGGHTPWNTTMVDDLIWANSCQNIMCSNLDATVTSLGLQVNLSLTVYSLRLLLTVGTIVPTTASFTNSVTLLNVSWACSDILNVYDLQLWNGTAYNAFQTDMCAASSKNLTNGDVFGNAVRFRVQDPTGVQGYPNGTLSMDWFTVFLEAEGISGGDLGWFILFILAMAVVLIVGYMIHKFQNRKGSGV